MTSWKDKTCERCWFRVGTECRKGPPATRFPIGQYPPVFHRLNDDQHEYSPACSQYGEPLEQAQKQDDLFSQGQAGSVDADGLPRRTRR